MTNSPPTAENLRALSDLILGARLLGPYDLPAHIARHGRRLGLGDVLVYLADLQGRVLVPFLAGGQSDADHQASPLLIDSTLAGRVFQQLESLGQQDGHGRVRTWVPVLSGMERLGVLAADLEVSSDTDEAEHQRMVALFASAVAELVVTKQLHGDTIVRLRRTATMGLAAEIQWGMLPPLTFADRRVSVAAALEPAYDVAGDSVDYAVDQDVARFAVFDGMGHGLRSSQLASMVVAAYRNARRAGRSLTETWSQMDAVVEESFAGDEFVTGVLAELDSGTGTLRWINAGHPEPLLIRNGRSVKSLDVEPQLPLGCGLGARKADDGANPAWQCHVGTVHLQPGDYFLLYTDGVVESRSPDGELFGVERLTDMVVKNLSAGMPAAETMRRVVRALLTHQGADLADDATMLIAQWRPVHEPSGG